MLWPLLAPTPTRLSFGMVLAAPLEHVPPPEPVEPHTPGPFAFADRSYVKRFLTDAGFQDIDIRSLAEDVVFPNLGGIEKAVEFFIKLGPARRLVEDKPPDIVAKVRTAIVAALTGHTSDEGFKLSTKSWIVTARN